MTWQFGRIDLGKTTYAALQQDWNMLENPPIDQMLSVYRQYCRHRRFASVIPMVPGRFVAPGTELFGYWSGLRLAAWSMYRIWDEHNILSDQFAWDYQNPKLRLGITSLVNECAVYRDRGYRWMYFESVEPYMFDIDGFELLGPIA